MFLNKEVLERIDKLSKEIKSAKDDTALTTRKKTLELVDMMLKKIVSETRDKYDELKEAVEKEKEDIYNFREKYFALAKTMEENSKVFMQFGERFESVRSENSSYKVAEGRIDYLLANHFLFKHLKVEKSRPLLQKIEAIDGVLFSPGFSLLQKQLKENETQTVKEIKEVMDFLDCR